MPYKAKELGLAKINGCILPFSSLLLDNFKCIFANSYIEINLNNDVYFYVKLENSELMLTINDDSGKKQHLINDGASLTPRATEYAIQCANNKHDLSKYFELKTVCKATNFVSVTSDYNEKSILILIIFLTCLVKS